MLDYFQVITLVIGAFAAGFGFCKYGYDKKWDKE